MEGFDRLTIKSLLEKLVEFIIKLRRPKTTKTQKTITINPNKTPSSNKISQRGSPDTQIKQVEHSHKQTTLTPYLKKTQEPVTEFPTSVITVGSSEIPYLQPGIVIDACIFCMMEDFPEIKEYVASMISKLKNPPIYVPDIIKKEYRRKKCPKNYGEMISSNSLHPNKYTGEPRNFNHTLADWFESSGVTIYFVEAEKSSKVRKSAKKCLTELKKFGLHTPDHMYLGIARITNSVVMTLDCKMIRSAKKGKVKTIDFREFLDEVMSPEKSPMTRLEEDRQYYATIKASEQVQFLRQLKKKRAKTIELYGNRNSAINSRKKR